MKRAKILFLAVLSIFLFSCKKDLPGDLNHFSTKEKKEIGKYLNNKENYKNEFRREFDDIKTGSILTETTIKGIGKTIDKGGEHPFLFTFDKKNGIYKKAIASDYFGLKTTCTTRFENLFEPTENVPMVDEQTLTKLIEKKDYDYAIEYGARPNLIIMVYVLDENEFGDTSLNNQYFVYIEKSDKGYVALTDEKVIGEYATLEEAILDEKVTPVPLDIMKMRNYPLKSRKIGKFDEKPLFEFDRDGYFGRVYKKSSMFYKLELWDNSKEKSNEKQPDFIIENGTKTGETSYEFDSYKAKVKIDKDIVEVQIVN